jgi:hypothetical protein
MNIMRDMVTMDEDNKVQQDCKLKSSTEVQTGDETEDEPG